MAGSLRIATLNCEGIKRSRDYINNFLSITSCDILCIQESWHLDDNIMIFNSIHPDYLYTAISGIDSRKQFLVGRPKGGVGILYKKTLSGRITAIKSTNRRISGIICHFTEYFSCLLLSVYLPCDNYCNTVNKEYSDCIDYIETLLNNLHCNAFVCCGDYNSSFERKNAQTECLNNFITRNDLTPSWDNLVSKKDFTYSNLALNQFSCIDHIITTRNIFNCIRENYVINEPCNPSTHNIVYLCISIDDFKHIVEGKRDEARAPNCIWSKASVDHIEQYQLSFDDKLFSIDLNKRLAL